MDAVMPSGFFANTHEIYAEVASYPVVPPEKIRHYWNAYTTTFRRLVDPSAFRLENFWWHVWGSDRRHLSGPVLARLFEEFSNGPTFVPLPSSADRCERLRPRDPGPRAVDGHSRGPDPDPGSGQESAPTETKKVPTLSSSRPPPPHPILKKSSGPSAPRRRPTARFVSPPASGDEGVDEGHTVSTITVVAALEMPPPPLPSSAKLKKTVPLTQASPAPKSMSPPPRPSERQETAPGAPSAVSGIKAGLHPCPPPSRGERGPATGSRKIVVSTAASRRKPVVVRRRSSQSASGADPGQRPAGYASPTATTRPGNRRQALTASQLLGQGSLSPQTKTPGANCMVAGKCPTKTVVTGQLPSPRSLAAQADGHVDDPVARQRVIEPQQRSTWDVRDGRVSQAAARGQPEAVRLSGAAPPQTPPQVPARGPPPVAGFVADSMMSRGAAPMVRSRSGNPRDPGVALLPSQATSSVATFGTTARGQFDSEVVTPGPVVPEAKDIPHSVSLASRPSPSTLLDSKLKPTPPNPAPPIPFGRSRSELTLLLERHRKGEGT